MSSHPPKLEWSRGDDEFVRSRYSRAHTWTFDGGARVPASSSPDVVRPPLSDPAGVDPEEALVAALASCHMMWFLAIASKRGFIVDHYEDHPVGKLGTDEAKRTSVTEIELTPRAVFSGEQHPSADDLKAMHEEAHRQCFIANSLRSKVTVSPQSQ